MKNTKLLKTNTMLKTFKEYLNYMGGFRLGYIDNISPMASLGDKPPKGQAGKDSRGVGLHATYSTQAAGTMRPFLTANVEKKKIEMMKLTRQAMSIMPGSKRQKDIIKKLNIVRKDLKLEPVKEDKEMEDFLDDLANNTPNESQFEDIKRIPRKSGQKADSKKHSDLYTDENPKGTIHGLGFTDGTKARQSVNKIKNSGKTHAHKIQAAIAMSQRAKVASERAKDPKKKKDLGAAHKIYQSYIDTNKKKD
jgi:hypothetical protein|tara:strand:- start:228 stop:977 length:750 start_codon:yes stop_codon:yes gene_type:complete